MKANITLEQVNDFIKAEELDVEEVEQGGDGVSALFGIVVALTKPLYK